MHAYIILTPLSATRTGVAHSWQQQQQQQQQQQPQQQQQQQQRSSCCSPGELYADAGDAPASRSTLDEWPAGISVST
jgi:transcription initiation factor TFIID subunit TAF12